MNLREAAEMALEFASWFTRNDHSIRPKHKAPEVVEALRQALAQPEQEPVAWQDPQYKTLIEPHKAHPDWIPLYTAPPEREWVGLTDEERQEIVRREVHWSGICRVIEAKLKEKNT